MGTYFRSGLRHAIRCTESNCLLVTNSGNTIVHRWSEGKRFLLYTSADFDYQFGDDGAIPGSN